MLCSLVEFFFFALPVEMIAETVKIKRIVAFILCVIVPKLKLRVCTGVGVSVRTGSIPR